MEVTGATIRELERLVPGRVRVDEPMARHTSFGLGGPADVFVAPADEPAFKDCVGLLADAGVPITVLGRGTNVLVRTGGIEGAVLVVEEAFDALDRQGEGVVAGSGVPLSRLLSFCAEEGLSGLEGLAGIPGTVGGAAVTNAGSFGVSFGDVLREVVVFRPGGRSTVLTAGELDLTYRRTAVPRDVIVERVTLELTAGDPSGIAAAQREKLETKWRTQPCGMRSAGCVFRNPPGQSAGKLIEQAGLKGLRVGGAVVSDRHANFILNDRGASSDDVEELIELVRSRVSEKTGVELELEIEILGRPSL